ncbi:MAG: RIP metalloprotease RseP [Bryobacteraceae bacterium]
MVFLENVWWFLVLIGVMVILHELGHFWAARFFDVKVETFSFGFGPRLFGFKRGDTDYRFSPILVGGYVKMAGDQPGDESASDPRSLVAKPRWQRLIITFAGPAINVVLAMVLLTGLFMKHYEKIPTPPDPVIGYIAPDGAAAKAGIKEGDRVVQFDDLTDPNWEQITLKIVTSPKQPRQVWVQRDGQRLHFILVPTLDEKEGVAVAGWGQETQLEVGTVNPGMSAARAGLKSGDILVSANGQPLRSIARLNQIESETHGSPIDLVYSRAGQQHSVVVAPQKSDLGGQERWMIGLSIEPHVEIEQLPFTQAVYQSYRENASNAQLIVRVLEGIVEHRMSARSLTGPVGIAQMSGEAAREGPATFIGLMATVSLNLGIVNLLPIPIMDGGGILMLLIEMVMRRDMDLNVKEAMMKVGIVFLMAILVFVIYNDISKMLPG